jgi:hypothetical protein
MVTGGKRGGLCHGELACATIRGLGVPARAHDRIGTPKHGYEHTWELGGSLQQLQSRQIL